MRVVGVDSGSFSFSTHPYPIRITFDTPELDLSAAEFELKSVTDSGAETRVAHWTGQSPIGGTASVELIVDKALSAGLYILQIKGVKDLYGNLLLTNTAGTNLYTERLLKPIGGETPSVRPGITGSTGPYVTYSEFTKPRDVPDGFNPHDKVETRVARLYYYRDAHRVAQIINRKVRSYNRAGVDMQRQLADNARTEADKRTDARQVAERNAIILAQRTREKEQELQAAEQSLSRSIQELSNYRTTNPQDGATADPATDQTIQQLEALTQSFANRADDLRVQVRALRDQEVAANEEAIQMEASEKRAREEQFRREVAAAHADPDTYAPGVPRSDDPVEQVSVSVIGEGLIHLRGPLKGVNTIRTMIDQIDQPVGQVRVAVHTVQINGEKQARMEDVANIIQMYIDHSRFLTTQTSEMLRKAVVQVASRKADTARMLYPGDTQEDRDRRYLDSFFGKDFIDELVTMDSEFLRTGNKILSLHSMDTTSLSSALNLMALAKNSTRMEIFQQFDEMLQGELPMAEAAYIQASMTACQKKHSFKHPPKFYPMAQNAAFQSLRGFFDMQIGHDDTLTPLQREFIRLAQIFKGRLITELEYKQRVRERALIEERLGNRLQDLEDAKRKEKVAQSELELAKVAVNQQREPVVRVMTQLLASRDLMQHALQAFEESYREFHEPFANFRPDDAGVTIRLGEHNVALKYDPRSGLVVPSPDDPVILQLMRRNYEKAVADFRRILAVLEGVEFTGQNALDFSEIDEILTDAESSIAGNRDSAPWTFINQVALEDAAALLRPLVEVAITRYAEAERLGGLILSNLRKNPPNVEEAYREWLSLSKLIRDSLKGQARESLATLLREGENSFLTLIASTIRLESAYRSAEQSRRPLDHKKFLDMLIDDLEEKYIELLEGTRAHTANVDNYLKRVTTALDDDFNVQFYNPAFRYIRETGSSWDVQFGQTETTNILANNRELGKVEPSATMEFDLPARGIVISEALNGAKALMNDVGALANDPTFLAMAQSQMGSPADMARGSSGGYGAVRNVIPGLQTSTAEHVMAHNAGERPQLGSNLENLIPDPAIYKFETGTGYEIRPVIQPDGQAVVFDFHYMYTTNVREPVRADEKHLGRVKRHFINTDVQLSNFELREVSRYTVALKAARTSRGVPLLEDIPGVGVLFRPLPSDESSLQQNIILSQATIFPTLFDLMGLRWAPAAADLDPLRVTNREFVVRARNRLLENRVYDYSSAQVDEFLRIPEANRRSDVYRTQESIPGMHPNGYQGPGLDLRDSHLQEGYQPQRAYPDDRFIPGASKEGSPLLPRRDRDLPEGVIIEAYPLEGIAPARPDPQPMLESPMGRMR